MDSIPKIDQRSDKEYVDTRDLFSYQYLIEQELPPNVEEPNDCLEYDREVTTLKHLTAVNCSSAPKYIADFRLDEDNPWVKSGYLWFVVMSRVPGRSMSEVWREVPRSPPNDQVLRIWRAFEVALL